MSNQINDGGPAFPAVYYSEPVGSIGPQLVVKGGASLRDYFAAAALQGFLSNAEASRAWNESDVARFCYFQADEMLKAREVKP